jgi:nucleotide-binding universal stress UspA family protein
MLSKILVPVDGSENSFRALEHAIFLSRKIEGAQTTVTHIKANQQKYLKDVKIWLIRVE